MPGHSFASCIFLDAAEAANAWNDDNEDVTGKGGPLARARDASARDVPAPASALAIASGDLRQRPGQTLRRVGLDLRQLFSYARRETLELRRDPIRQALAILGSAILMLVLGYGITLDVENLTFAVLDRDQTVLSRDYVSNLAGSRYFIERAPIRDYADLDRRMRAGELSLAIEIPPGFQRDVLAGRSPTVQLNVDATRMSQAFTGSAYVQSIVTGEVDAFVARNRVASIPAVDLALRVRFNPELNKSWFGSVMEVVNNITMLSIVLTGAALIREREHGTVEHLPAMPVTPFETMAAKVWAMGVVVLVAAGLSLTFVVQGLPSVPIEGSKALFLAGAALHLFATASMGIFLATIARSMPQFGLLLLLVLLPLETLSGGMTPRESMPQLVQLIMLAAPTTHFVALAQAALYRGAGPAVVWPPFIALAVIGATLLSLSLARFRKTLAAMA